MLFTEAENMIKRGMCYQQQLPLCKCVTYLWAPGHLSSGLLATGAGGSVSSRELLSREEQRTEQPGPGAEGHLH